MPPKFISSWLDHFEQGRFSTELLSMKIVGPHGEFNGQGFMQWTEKRGTRINALSDGGRILDGVFFDGVQPTCGKLITKSEYATLEAVTGDSSSLHIERFWPHCYSIRSGHDTTIWRIGQTHILSEITFRKEARLPEDIRSEMLLTSADNMLWPRADSHLNRCLEFETSYGKVYAWKRKRLARLLVRYAKQCEWRGLANAIIIAFRFWASCQVAPVAMEHTDGRDITRRIPPKPLRSYSPIAPPLGYLPIQELEAYHEILLARCVEFFADEKNSDVAVLVSAFLSSANLPFSVQSLITAVCVEGLAKRVASTQAKAVSISPEQRVSVHELLKANLPADLVGRFDGFMNRMNEPSGANAISEWCKNGILGFGKEDGDAFSLLRNRTAHGKLDLFGSDDTDKQASLVARNRLFGMLNRLVLNLVGYDGPYFDYRTWKVVSSPQG